MTMEELLWFVRWAILLAYIVGVAVVINKAQPKRKERKTS